MRSMPLSITATVTGASCGAGSTSAVGERVDGCEIPLARRERIGRRPGQRAARPRGARARARRGSCRRRASAPASGRPWPARGSGTLPSGARRRAGDPGPATADARAGARRSRARRAGYSRPFSRAPGRPRSSTPECRITGTARRRQRARDEPVARRLADRAPERATGAVVGHRARDDVAPAEARRRPAASPRRAARSREQHAVAHDARVQGDLRRLRGRRRPGVTVNQVERRPRRLRASAAESTSGPALPFSVTVCTRPDG